MHQQPFWLSGICHLVILYLAFEAETPGAWPYALMAMAVVSFFAWAGCYRRYRQIHDVPTSKIASAAQGYVELLGRADMLPGKPITSRLSRQPCCWYHFQVEEKASDNKWKQIESGTSTDQFLIIDDTGQCIISPESAEVLTHDHKSWTEGSYRYNEWLLLPKGVFYAIGEFSTLSGNPEATTGNDERAELSALLSDWKKDQKRLHERFDLNRDGAIDIKEWEHARMEAHREVRRRQSAEQTRSVDGIHFMRKPRDGRLFLLANEMPDKLGSRYRFWAWVHLIIFLVAGSAGLMML